MLLIGVILLLSCARMYPELLGMGLLSFTLGLSHAFDIDHISAIDNMIRKLIQQQKNPRGVGFFFSLGHSTVVIIMALATIFAVKWAQTSISSFNTSGGVIVSAVSGCLLLALGLINLIMLKNTLKAFKGVRRGEQNPEKHQEPPQGLINRAINLLFNLVNNNWQVFAVGFLFGLGFDTATQIAVLATSASAASEAIPWLSVLSFPLLFTAGMTMMDTLDSVFMCTAYQWVFDSPLRKLYYNLTITGLSILAAGAVGIIEIAQVVSQEMGLSGGFWLWLQNLNFNITGYILVGIFVVVFIASYAGWKLLHLGEKEKLEASTLSVEGLGR
jgi:high-affinity nickel-transport protein